MKNYLNLLVFVLFAVLLGSVSYLIYSNEELKKENTRQKNNIETLNDSNTYLKDKNGNLFVQVGSLDYTVKELKKYRGEDAKLITDLNIKLKNVQTITKTEYKVETEFKDKLIYKDSLTCFDWSDGYTRFSGCMDKDSIAAKAEYTDSITAVVSLERPYKWWFIKYGKKVPKLSAKCENPNAVLKIGLITIK